VLLKRCSDRCGDKRGRGIVVEQRVDYGAASAGEEREELQLVSNTETSCGLEGEKMMKWPLVKLLSINTSVGSREQAAGRVDSGPVARLNQHRRRVSSSLLMCLAINQKHS